MLETSKGFNAINSLGKPIHYDLSQIAWFLEGAAVTDGVFGVIALPLAATEELSMINHRRFHRWSFAPKSHSVTAG